MMKASGSTMANSSPAKDDAAGASGTASADMAVPLARDRMAVMAVRDRLDMGGCMGLVCRGAEGAGAAYRSRCAARGGGATA
ncbi:hypothetical protein GCM10011394_01230 [Luteimonas terricola]|uniref:Uncharacterized protein n=1 Tax=Luteimonas terricola TaxID=645597 RepID=A0ABQ2E5T6_9GAMM|nr:hypothetical protein GCM10011394_01230 [Luteimonas terricola]